MLAGFLFILPKIGPLKLIDVKGPTPATETAYLHSVVVSTVIMHRMFARFTPPATAPTSTSRAGDPVSTNQSPQAISAVMTAGPNTLLLSRDPRHPLPNRDLDTGRVVEPGGYSLTASTYANLLHRTRPSQQSRTRRSGRRCRPISQSSQSCPPARSRCRIPRMATMHPPARRRHCGCLRSRSPADRSSSVV